MRFALILEQRDFFRKNHFIEFEGLLSAAQIQQLNAQIDNHILHEPSKYSNIETTDYYDLWRDIETVKKTIHKPCITHIASELFEICPLRIAFDQLFVPFSENPLFQTSSSLTDFCCIKPLAGGILFLLEGLKDDSLRTDSFPLPKTPGNALFISPTFIIPWPELFSLHGLRFLFVAFAPEKSFYRQEQTDPYSSLLKKWGYAYNDCLKSDLHPILFSKK